MGIQALERAMPTQPMTLGQPERQEFEYIRHGTVSLIANWDIAQGQVVCPSVGATHTEYDFANPIARTIETAPDDAWIFIVNQLNTHQSASLVRLVAACCQLDAELGVKVSQAFLHPCPHEPRFWLTPVIGFTLSTFPNIPPDNAELQAQVN